MPTYTGSTSHDTITGSTTNDDVYAGPGNDSVLASDGNDSVYGGAGNDTLDGQNGNDVVSGESGQDTILGGVGSDTVSGGEGRDVVFGNQDNDFVVGDGFVVDPSDYASSGTTAATLTLTNSADGPLELYWVNSSGTPQFFATVQAGGTHVQSTSLLHNWLLWDPATNQYLARVTITNSSTSYNYGSDGLEDSLFGGDGNDSILGMYGNDTMYGDAGLDTIFGGTGRDLIYGGLDNDHAFGGAERDTLDGGAGNDTLEGGDGDDTLIGGAGADRLIGGTGRDTADYSASGQGVTVNLLTGTAFGGDAEGDTLIGVDNAIGSEFNDVLTFHNTHGSLFGGGGNDTLFGGAGSGNELFGGNGDDLIAGLAGADRLVGGNGADTLIASGNDTIDGGEGDSAVDVLRLEAGGTVAYGGGNNEAGTVTWSDGTVVSFTGIEQIEMAGVVDGTASADNIGASYVDQQGDQIDGTDGNDDVVSAGSGNDTVDSGAGNDTVFGGAGDDSLIGNVGNDSAFGDAGNDTLSGGDGDDTLSGGAGTDLLQGGTGADSLTGSDGNDTLDGGADNDLLDGGLHADLLLGNSGDDRMFGGDGNDTGAGGNGNDTLDGGAGNDWLLGDANNDSLTGGDGNDRLEGGTHNDNLSGGNDNDTLLGGTGSDTLTGDAGSDLVHGGDDADLLFGGDGDDTLHGGTGADSVLGGAGNDVIVVTSDDSVDVFDGGTGIDTLDLSGATTGANVDLGAGGQGFLRLGTGPDDQVSGIDIVTGTAFNDTIVGTGSNQETLSGGAGNDFIRARGGDDAGFGGDGDDTLNGNEGNNTLAGGTGNDTFLLDGTSINATNLISGGENAGDFDLLDYSARTDAVTVTFTGTGSGTGSSATFSEIEGVRTGSGDDQIDATADTQGVLVQTGAGADRATGGSGSDTLMGGAGNDTLDGGSGDDQLSGDDDADQLNGAGGNDTLVGGTGNDTLLGGDGNDTLTGGAGNDLLFGGEGSDTAVFSGAVTDYTFARGPNGELVVTSGPGITDGTDALSGVEFASFNGVTYRVMTGDEADNQTLQGPADGIPVLVVAYGGADWGGGHATDDVMFGGDGSDTLDGGDGADRLSGDGGNDLLRGDGGNDTLSGGDGADTLRGGTGDDLLLGGDGADIIELSLTGGTDRVADFNMTVVNGRTVDQLDVSELVTANGDPVTWRDITLSDTIGDGSGDAVLNFPGGERLVLEGVSFQQASGKANLYAMGIPCFATGTPILTSEGWCKVEKLTVGQSVMTEAGPSRIIWAGARRLDADDLMRNPDQRPIHFPIGSIGNSRVLRLSPQHAVRLRDGHGEKVLVRARHLAEIGFGGARIARGVREVVYCHVLLERHAVMNAAGAATESFYPGRMALAMLDWPARMEVVATILAKGRAAIPVSEAMVRTIYGPRVHPLIGRSHFDGLTYAPFGAGSAPFACPWTSPNNGQDAALPLQQVS